MKRYNSLFVFALLALGTSATERVANAGEAQLDGSLTARASTWRGDFGGGGQLRLGYRFVRIVAVDAAVWEEYAAVDHRLNTGLTFGASGFLPLETVRPSVRLYFIHQHEEPAVSVEESPFTTAFGIGDGIRHRAGGGATLGVEVPLGRSRHIEYVFVGGGSATWFPDATLGPGFYFGFSAGLGISYTLPGLP